MTSAVHHLPQDAPPKSNEKTFGPDHPTVITALDKVMPLHAGPRLLRQTSVARELARTRLTVSPQFNRVKTNQRVNRPAVERVSVSSRTRDVDIPQMRAISITSLSPSLYAMTFIKS